MKRFKIIFKGLVQGVGFRWTISNLAKKYDISGYAENLLNGDVLAEIQGNQENIDALLNELFNNARYIRIDDYQIKSIDTIEGEYFFTTK